MELKKLIKDIFHIGKWKMYLYISNQFVKRVYLNDEEELPEYIVINVRNKKHILGTNKKVKLVVKPMNLKFNNEKKKELHIEVKLFSGIPLENYLNKEVDE